MSKVRSERTVHIDPGPVAMRDESLGYRFAPCCAAPRLVRTWLTSFGSPMCEVLVCRRCASWHVIDAATFELAAAAGTGLLAAPFREANDASVRSNA